MEFWYSECIVSAQYGWPFESLYWQFWLREQERSVVCGKRQIWIGCKWRHLITVYTQTDQLWVGDDVDDDGVDDDDGDNDDGDNDDDGNDDGNHDNDDHDGNDDGF